MAVTPAAGLRAPSAGGPAIRSRPAAPLSRRAPPRVLALAAVADFTPDELAHLIASGGVQLIDVRERDEHEAGRIAGGRLIELGLLGSQARTIERGAPIVFYCRSGARSAMAADAFAQAGFEAHNLAGGLLAWEAAGLPLEPDDGYVA